MILKGSTRSAGGPAELADRIAADKLAYHLRRHFRRSQDVDVLHGVRMRSGAVDGRDGPPRAARPRSGGGAARSACRPSARR